MKFNAYKSSLKHEVLQLTKNKINKYTTGFSYRQWHPVCPNWTPRNPSRDDGILSSSTGQWVLGCSTMTVAPRLPYRYSRYAELTWHRPTKIRPIAWKSNVSSQLKTRVNRPSWLPRAFTDSVFPVPAGPNGEPPRRECSAWVMVR